MEARRKGADVQQQIDHAAEQYSRPQRWGLSGLHEPHQFLQQATRHRGSEVRYGTELSSFEPDGTGVTAVLRDRDSGKSDTVRADYLFTRGVHLPRTRITSKVVTKERAVTPIRK